MQEQDRIIKINIEEEMKSSYIDTVRNDGAGKYFGQTL